MEAMEGDWCDLCLREIENVIGSYRDHVFVVCTECNSALEHDVVKSREKYNDSAIA